MQRKSIHAKVTPINFASQSDHAEGPHVAIIMDGNGRWASQRGLPRVAGHRAGAEASRRVVEHALELGVARLTLYAFSSDNWRRPAFEVDGIFWLLRRYLRLERERLQRLGGRLEIVGRRDRLPEMLVREMEEAERLTAGGRSIHVRVAVDYSSRHAIFRAAEAAMTAMVSMTAMAAMACPAASPESDLRERGRHAALLPGCEGAEARFVGEMSRGNCDVDLLIRTGGEKRLSDFLLWESAYAELVFLDCMWPDFGAAELDAALCDFRRRNRRFGGIQLASPATASKG
jgi:undecaprenyl diphosphate synthase